MASYTPAPPQGALDDEHGPSASRRPGGPAAGHAGRYPEDTGVYTLSPAEAVQVDGVLGEAMARVGSAEEPAALAAARSWAYRLPGGLIRFMEDFRATEPTAGIVVRGLQVDDARIGTTPSHWDAQRDRRSTLREELYFLLLGALLGEPFGWSTLQGGRLIQNVVPIRGEEGEQSGHGTILLEWHTEDGFHPYRCDYLGLMALRNHDGVSTTFASVAAVNLGERARRVLSEPRFVIRPDNEHLRRQPGNRPAWAATAPAELRRMWDDPEPCAVLFGSLDRPYLRIDPFFMNAVPGDAEADAALAEIVAELNAALRDFPLAAGEVGFIDNYRAVHGRRAFEARHDGNDRWLKKLVLARDLRKSRVLRGGPASRVLL